MGRRFHLSLLQVIASMLAVLTHSDSDQWNCLLRSSTLHLRIATQSRCKSIRHTDLMSVRTEREVEAETNRVCE